jgi:hypothetical protein
MAEEARAVAVAAEVAVAEVLQLEPVEELLEDLVVLHLL